MPCNATTKKVQFRVRETSSEVDFLTNRSSLYSYSTICVYLDNGLWTLGRTIYLLVNILVCNQNFATYYLLVMVNTETVFSITISVYILLLYHSHGIPISDEFGF